MVNSKKIAAWILCLTLLVAGIWGCGRSEAPRAQPPRKAISAVSWPEADRLFRQDPRWLGADDAYSVDLKDGRILWLFGDSFIALTEKGSRSKAAIIRNSVGLQAGNDPAHATMQYYWRRKGDLPQSFFPESGAVWFWPGNGIRIGAKLMIFLMAVGSAPNELGFALTGWSAVVIDNIQGSPLEWRFLPPVPMASPFGVMLGAGSVFLRDDYLYAFGFQPDKGTVYLVRWKVSAAMAGNYCGPQWWTDPPGRWVSTADLKTAPQALFNQGQSEFSVHFEPELSRFVEIQTVGFGPAGIGWRTAPEITGPWSPLRLFYQPEEQRLSQVLIYAAKAHPHLNSDNTVLTYVTNSLIYEDVIENSDLYYPRFLKVRF